MSGTWINGANAEPACHLFFRILDRIMDRQQSGLVSRCAVTSQADTAGNMVKVTCGKEVFAVKNGKSVTPV